MVGPVAALLITVDVATVQVSLPALGLHHWESLPNIGLH
jgi:hypothetical protein